MRGLYGIKEIKSIFEGSRSKGCVEVVVNAKSEGFKGTEGVGYGA